MRRGVVVAAAIVLAGAAGCTHNPDLHDPAPTFTHVDTAPAFDTSEPRALAGWADAIFAGTVLERSGSASRTALPETQFRVEVIATLKGDLGHVVTVNQEGGNVPGTNEIVVVDGDPLIAAGTSYLFATRYSPEMDWYTIASGVGDIELTADEMRAVRAGARAPGAPEPEQIKKMRDAIAGQIPFRGAQHP
ncbi:hypothetical protein ACFXK0_07565 [Nocardia sp. NPDC059177]|uniref:hypothetical protein n=1 Tax=Nocardia sp. NPDC059177 TaxID=3346759 RepID=UPI003674BF0B